MEKNKKAGSMILGVAFVWFTTHFGGGFASGAQIYSYYVRYGVWSLLMPFLAMAYNGVFFAYCLYFARKHQVYDYRSYNDAFYGKYAPVFSNLFEVLYLCVMCVAPAVAFATGGATLSTLTGVPYLFCTLLIGVFIFAVAIFGTDLVRKVSSVLSVCIIIGLLAVYVPNIIAGAGKIGETISVMTESHMPFGKALYAAFLYGTFQLANVAVFVQHAKSFEKPKDAVKSMAIGGVVNAILMVMVVLGIMTVYLDPEMSRQSVPTLFMVQNGVGKLFLTPLISVLIILGAVSTAVNMVAAMVQRICHGLEKKTQQTKQEQKKVVSKTQILVALVCCVADFGIAQFGLLTLIQKAYSILAYLAIPVILVPYIVHMVVTRMDTRNERITEEKSR